MSNHENNPSDNKGFPWFGLLWGLVFSLVAVMIAGWFFTRALTTQPLAAEFPTPTLIILTSPPTAIPTMTPLIATPTISPTKTPVPTPDLSVPQSELKEGYFGVVTGSVEGIGVRLRPDPQLYNEPITQIENRTAVLILDGPEEGTDILWWNVQLSDGTEGWMAQIYLAPAAKPANWDSATGLAQAFEPTATPLPPLLEGAPVEIGRFAVVTSDIDFGVRFRSAPNTDNVPLRDLPSDTVGYVMDGPAFGSGFSWWRIQLYDGQDGWVAANYLVSIENPVEWPWLDLE